MTDGMSEGARICKEADNKRTMSENKERVIVFCDCGIDFSVLKDSPFAAEGKCIDCFLKDIAEIRKEVEELTGVDYGVKDSQKES